MANNLREEPLEFIHENPGEIKWHNPCKASIEKLEDGRLGIVLLPQNIPNSDETLTIISKINSDCKYTPHDSLKTGVRVTKIDGHTITTLQFEQVADILKNIKGKKNSVELEVYSPYLWQESKTNRSLFRTGQVVDGLIPLCITYAGSSTGKQDNAGNSESMVDIASETLRRPSNIKWNDIKKTVVIKKEKKEKKIGLHYKVKKADHEVYFLVEDIDRMSPCDGKLHRGDWIRSINGEDLVRKELNAQSTNSSQTETKCCCGRFSTKVEGSYNRVVKLCHGVFFPKSVPQSSISEQFKQTVQKSKEIELVIQRPENVVPASDTRRLHLSHIAPRKNRDTDQIDGRSAYSVSTDTMSLAGRSMVSQSRRYRSRPYLNIPTGRKPTQHSGIQHVPLHKDQEQTVAEVATDVPASEGIDEAVNRVAEEINEQGIDIDMQYEDSPQAVLSKCEECLTYLTGEDIKHVPYVNVNIIATTAANVQQDVLQRVKAEFQCQGNTAETQIYQISKNSLETLDGSASAEYTIDDVILAKHLTKNLKGSSNDAFIERLKQVLVDGHCNVQGLPDQLLKKFLQDPPPLHKDYLEIQFKAFTYEELLHLWPTVYFTSSSVYVIVFDVESLSSPQSREIQQIQTCINLIHTSSSKTKIYLVAKKPATATRLDVIMSHFDTLNDHLKDNHDIYCGQCRCDKGSLYSSSYSQIQQSDATGHIAYCMERDEDWTTFIQDLKSQLCQEFKGEQRFPLLAVMVMKMIRQLNLRGMVTMTNTRLKQCIVEKGLPDVDEEALTKVLAALHHCGKLCCFSQVAHRTVHSSAHNQYILLHPGAIQACAEHISRKLPKKSGTLPGPVLRESDILNDLMCDIPYQAKEELLFFLQLYHILEEFPDKGRYLHSQSYVRVQDTQVLDENVSEMRESPLWRVMYIDFHGLLPLTMCLPLLLRVGEVMTSSSNTDISSSCTGQFVYSRVRFLVHLLPYQGRALVLVNPETPLSIGDLYSFLESVLGNAVQTNLLTYHIGEPCMECVERLDTPTDHPLKLVQRVHIKEYTTPKTLDSWSFLPQGHLTVLDELPRYLADILIQGLDIQDPSTQCAGWKILYKRLGYTSDDSLWRQLEFYESPASAFYNFLLRKQITVADLMDSLEGTAGSHFVVERLKQMKHSNSSCV